MLHIVIAVEAKFMKRLHMVPGRGSPRFWVFLQGEVSTAAIHPLLETQPTRIWHTLHQGARHCPTITGKVLKIPGVTLSTDFFPPQVAGSG